MKQILIVFGSKYGCTRQCAQQLQQEIKGKVTLLDVSKWKKGKTSVVCDSENRIYDGLQNIDLSFYDLIIIGGSFYVGRWQAGLADFIAIHGDTIKAKKHAFFACHMQQGSDLENQLALNIPESLSKTAIAIGCFGGIFDFKQMNFMEKLIVKQVAKSKHEPITANNLDTNAIKQFAWQIERNS